MKISLILNTACMDPIVAGRSNTYRDAQYVSRIDMLRETIADAKDFDEIIVAGNYKAGDGYKYIEVQPHAHNRSDGLIQREVGARHSIGDILVFCHDDHRPGEGFAKIVWEHYGMPNSNSIDMLNISNTQNDLLIPKRIHKLNGSTLNNGKDDDYMGGHCLVMHRSLWAEVPWTLTDLTFWDVVMTRLWREAGANLIWHDELIHYDLEASEDED